MVKNFESASFRSAKIFDQFQQDLKYSHRLQKVDWLDDTIQSPATLSYSKNFSDSSRLGSGRFRPSLPLPPV
jgi:hypothetical protein